MEKFVGGDNGALGKGQGNNSIYTSNHILMLVGYSFFSRPNQQIKRLRDGDLWGLDGAVG